MVNRKKDIAVIGMAGVFPKSEDIAVFWENLQQGIHLATHHVKQQEEALTVNLPNFIPVTSKIENAGSFDYKFFGYSREEASVMDPQIRIMHEIVYGSLDNAGYANKLTEKSIGLYLSASDNINWRLLEMFFNQGTLSPYMTRKLSNKQYVSTLISYNLGLTGPSFYSDTACSASLSNVHLACRSLLLKECNIAVSGGVNISSTENQGYLYEEGLINSKDGYCRAFDKYASGTIWGEGAGAVVLKRYEDAVNDGDHIYAVVKATAVNNDGRRKVGYIAPSVEGQADCIKMALKVAGVAPNTISYIEAHGTGTKLGDPIEIAALNEAFNNDTNHTCAIGAVKSNMGHLDAAAGIAGFIKTCLSLYHKTIPPSLNFTEPNPEINFQGGPFYVNAQPKSWESNTPRRAGINSLGIGGANCHAILEEFTETNTVAESPKFNVLFYSAKTRNSLKAYREKLADYLEKNQAFTNAQIAYSLAEKAQTFPYKDAIVFHNTDEACKQLRNTPISPQTKRLKNKVFLFPGQGTQYLRMANDIYRSVSFFADIMNQGFEILHSKTNIDYKKIIGYTTPEDQKLIHQTKYTQPLLFLVEYAMAKTYIHYGIQPDVMIGHSLGEYVAACIAEVFTFETGLEIICERASLMDQMNPGDMIVLHTTQENIEMYMNENISVAAINSNDTCVLSGTREAVKSLEEILEKEEIAYTKLKTSHAFHSQMMDPMLKPFKEKLDTFTFNKPTIPIVSNLTGEIIATEELMSSSYWVNHVRNAVLFQKGIESLTQKWKPEDSVFIEVGPGKVLSNFFNKQLSKPIISISSIKNGKETQDDFYHFLTALTNIWKAGVSFNLTALYPEHSQKVPVPSYAFDTTNLPSRIDALQLIQQQFSGDENVNSLLSKISSNTVFNGDEAVEETIDHTSEVDERVNLSTNYIAAVNDVQKRLIVIWESILGHKKIGIEDDFFELGGDSLKAMSILNTIKKEFNCTLEIQEYFESPTIQTLSTKIEVLLKLKDIQKTAPQKNTFKI